MVDLRLQCRVVVSHLAARAAVGIDVGRLRGDVLLAAVELDALYAVGREEGGDLVAPPDLGGGVGRVHDEARAADVGAVRVPGPRGGVRDEVAAHLGLEPVVAAHPEAAPRHDVVAALLERLEHRRRVRQPRLVPDPLAEAVVADEHRPVEVVDARRNAERVVHEDVVGHLGVDGRAVEERGRSLVERVPPAPVEEGPVGRDDGPSDEARVLVEDGRVLGPDEEAEEETLALGRGARLEAEAHRPRVGLGEVEEPEGRAGDGEAVAPRRLEEGRVDREGGEDAHLHGLTAPLERAHLGRRDVVHGDVDHARGDHRRVAQTLGQAVEVLARRRAEAVAHRRHAGG